ncbi:MAG: sulfite exporter TauE/SafE family protein [Pseudomonadota bacterium]
MPDALGVALATPGLGWLILTITIAGLIRGFTGFGTALIFVPVAGQFLPPEQILLLITATGVLSTTALMPRAWSVADRVDVVRLAGPAALAVPGGLWLGGQMEPLAIRWVVAGIASVTLIALMSGWRYGGIVRPAGLIGIGAASGLIGGVTGMTGPVVILFYLAGQKTAEIVRANTILFLALLDLSIIILLAARGALDASILWLAAVIGLPYFVTTRVGQAFFRPGAERAYRIAAYCVIAGAVLAGLPLFDEN